MAFSSSQRIIYMVCVGSVCLLAGMHVATAIKGYNYFVDVVQVEAKTNLAKVVTYQTYEARLQLAMAAAGLTFLTNLISIILLFKPAHIKKLLNLVVFNLVIEVALGLITMMSIYEMSITRDFYFKYFPQVDWQTRWDNDGFNLFWRMLISDGILTFVPQIAGLIYIYLGVAKEVQNGLSGDQLTSDNGSSYGKLV